MTVPKFRKTTIKSDYFGDMEWWACKQCQDRPDGCRCNCAHPTGWCERSLPAAPKPAPVISERCSDCVFTSIDNVRNGNTQKIFSCGKTGISGPLHAQACIGFVRRK